MIQKAPVSDFQEEPTERSITEIFLDVQIRLAENLGEITPEIQKMLDTLDADFRSKLLWMCNQYRAHVTREKWLADKIARLQTSKKAAKNSQDFFKGRIDDLMKEHNYKKGSIGDFDVSYLPSKSVEILDESLVPDNYVKTKVTTSVDKASALKHLKAGKQIPGLRLNEKKNIQIK